MHVILRLQDEVSLVDLFQLTLSGREEGLGKSDHGRGREERIYSDSVMCCILGPLTAYLHQPFSTKL